MIAQRKRTNPLILSDNDVKILSNAASVKTNPYDIESLVEGRFCFICARYYATRFCELTAVDSDTGIEIHAWDKSLAKRRLKQRYGNINGACCFCCRCYSCNLRVVRYRNRLASTTYTTHSTLPSLLVADSQPPDEHIFDDEENDHSRTDDMVLQSEDAYLARIAGNTSGLKYRNRRVKVDKFIPGKFISVCIPAAVDSNNKALQQWPHWNRESNTSERVAITASDEHYHSVLVLFNIVPRCCPTSPVHVGICTCKFNVSTSGNTIRQLLESILTYLHENAAMLTLDEMEVYVTNQLQSFSAFQDIFGNTSSGLKCLECLHTKVIL